MSDDVLRAINEAPMGRDWDGDSAQAIVDALSGAGFTIVPTPVITAWHRLTQWGEENGIHSYVTGRAQPPAPDELVSSIIGILDDH